MKFGPNVHQILLISVRGNSSTFGHFWRKSRMPRTANFNWTVLRAQKELCAQIWTAFSVFPRFFEKLKILRGFLAFWSFFCGKLQFDGSRSSEGIERTDLMSGSSPIQCLLPFYKKYENPRKISCILVFLYLAQP